MVTSVQEPAGLAASPQLAAPFRPEATRTVIQNRRDATGPSEPAAFRLGRIPARTILAAVLADLTGPERVRHAPALVRSLSRWAACLHDARLDSDHGPVLAVWLTDGPETEVDQAFASEPALGLLLHRLASGLVMAALASLRPQAAERGCAPWPEPCPGLSAALAAHGLTDAQGRLARRYAVLTHDTPEAGCADCGLRRSCPGPRHGDRP